MVVMDTSMTLIPRTAGITSKIFVIVMSSEFLCILDSKEEVRVLPKSLFLLKQERFSKRCKPR